MKKIVLLVVSLIQVFLFVGSKAMAGSPAQGITVAGGNGRGSSPGQIENLSHFFIDRAGNIYISDGANHRIQKWAPGATSGITVAGGNGPGSAANQLYFPYGLFVDAAENIYVADLSNARVQKWAPGASAGITVAGGHDYGPAANQLAYPGAVIVDAAGNIFIADVLNHRIQKWAPGASEGITVAGGNGAGASANQFNQPEDIFIDRTGNLYVADANNSRIQKFTPGATSGVTVAGGFGKGSFSNQLYDPNGVFVDLAGNIYVCDRFNHRIQKWQAGSSGEGTTVAGGNGPGSAANQITYPTGVFVDAAGNLFVDDGDNSRIQKFTNINPPGSLAIGITVAGGNSSGSASNQLSFPNGIFIEPSGNIYVADYSNHRIQKWAPGATSGVTVAGGNGRGAGASQFNFPNDVFVDAAGNIYVTDMYNNRVQKWAPGASFGVTVAGGNGAGIADNQIFLPHGLFVDAAGNIYVSDEGANRVQKWAPGATRGITVAGGFGGGSAANQLTVPQGIFVDTIGNIYVTDRNNSRIQKWAPGATAGITVAGGNGPGSASFQLNYPSSVYVDPSGRIFITDVDNERVQKWEPGASEGTTIAGGNGLGSSATQFYVPSDIAVIAGGDFYISDFGNHRIQKFGAHADGIFCGKNLVITAPSCSSRVTLAWMEPRDTFPASISMTNGRNQIASSLLYKGTFNGHGYYESTDQYRWTEADRITLNAGAHLLTINSQAENDFVNTNINQRFNYAWIGLYNTGTAGSFAWVTGEPLHFTYWIPGEPNNLYNNLLDKTIFEPYVHINGYDSLSRWNDIGTNIDAKFLAEFDNTLHTYRQISGPANGSSQLPGVYNICYERINNNTGIKDTCCFSITVTCNNPAVSPEATALSVLVAPNPSRSMFRLNISGNQRERIRIEVIDVMGKLVESISNATPYEPVHIGSNYKPGLYFARVIQGNKKVTIKLVKQ